jgi:hypothetical protein
MVPVGEQRWFFRGEDDWAVMDEKLKLTPCPHCQRVGTLIRHGYLYGFDESSPRRKTVRARRVLCSNRNARPGCGRTFSVWRADKIRRLSVTAGTLWRFLKRAAAGSVVAAIHASHATPCHLSDRTWQRIWKRFHLGQSKIRTALLTQCPPPALPAQPTPRPVVQVLAHLQAAFAEADCPIAAFQHTFRTFFV